MTEVDSAYLPSGKRWRKNVPHHANITSACLRAERLAGRVEGHRLTRPALCLPARDGRIPDWMQLAPWGKSGNAWPHHATYPRSVSDLASFALRRACGTTVRGRHMPLMVAARWLPRASPARESTSGARFDSSQGLKARVVLLGVPGGCLARMHAPKPEPGEGKSPLWGRSAIFPHLACDTPPQRLARARRTALTSDSDASAGKPIGGNVDPYRCATCDKHCPVPSIAAEHCKETGDE